MSRLAKIPSVARRIGLTVEGLLVARKLDDFSLVAFQKCCREAKTVRAQIPAVRETEFSSFAHPLWNDFDAAVTRYFLGDGFGWSFLRQSIIGKTMFVRAGGSWQREQLRFLRSVRSSTVLRCLLRENRLGNPYITSLPMLSSHNTIHHLYHLLRYEHITHKAIEVVDSVVEFGGGYGNLARLTWKLKPKVTYTIIDLPTFSCIQLAYLSTVLGRHRVHIVDNTGELVSHKINLLPLPYLDRASNLQCELFISTWALSESTHAAQRYIAARRFFGARHLLLAYQVDNPLFGSPDKSVIEPLDFSQVFRENITFLGNAQYLFA